MVELIPNSILQRSVFRQILADCAVIPAEGEVVAVRPR
jgi:hypothetical protein